MLTTLQSDIRVVGGSVLDPGLARTKEAVLGGPAILQVASVTAITPQR